MGLNAGKKENLVSLAVRNSKVNLKAENLLIY